jgi:hypothetical protein
MFLNGCCKYVIRSFRYFYSDKSSRKVSMLGSKNNIFSKDNFYFIIGALCVRVATAFSLVKSQHAISIALAHRWFVI